MSVNVLRSIKAVLFGLALFAISGFSDAQAQAIKVQGTLTSKQQIRLDFKDGTSHLFTMVQREGTFEGSGPFAKLKAQDYAVHDVYPGVGGSQTGYLVVSKSDNDIAYLKWSSQSNFIQGTDGKTVVVNNGTWTLISGLGSFKGLKGNGSIKITFGKDNDRIYALEGNLTK